MESTVDNETLVRDVFPAEVLLPTGEMLRRCRVFITTHRMIAWQEDRRKLPMKVVDLTLAEVGSVNASKATMMKGDPIEVVGMSGHAYVNKSRGCGCGSTLKALTAPAPWVR